MMKKQKGITLIALIITIVLLIILASVAIADISGDGIMGKAEQQKNQFNEVETQFNVVANEIVGDIKNKLNPGENPDDAVHTHSYGSWVTTTAATCTTSGIKTRKCSCGLTETGTIDALGHILTPNGKCIDYNETYHTLLNDCSRCGSNVVQEGLEEHVFKNYIANSAGTEETATCEGNGCERTDTRSLKDTEPPTTPQINVVSGTLSESEDYYITEVEVEIIPGEDSFSGVKNTTYILNNGTEKDITTLTNNTLKISKVGTYTVVARTYDNEGNYSETTLTVTIKDETAPSEPSLVLAIGIKDSNKIYKTGVYVNLIGGVDSLSDSYKEYSLDGGATWNEYINGKDIQIMQEGDFEILARACDSVGNVSETVEILSGTIKIEKQTGSGIKVGSYVEYDVGYTDMWSSDSYTATSGWRYIGTDSDGNKLLLSSGIPMKICYGSGNEENYEKWWDLESTDYTMRPMWNGLIKNLDKIPYTKATSTSEQNRMIGMFEGTEITAEDGTTYTAIGNAFVSDTCSDKVLKVRAVTLEDLDNVISSSVTETIWTYYKANPGVSSMMWRTPGVVLMGECYGLFSWEYIGNGANSWDSLIVPSEEMKELPCNNYWGYIGLSSGPLMDGIRPVIVLSPDVEFEDSNGDGIYEIK